MDQVIRALIDRLIDKGMQIDVVPGYIRNALNTIAVDPFITLEELNVQMKSLGWHDLELDDYTFQLILASFGPDSDYDSTREFEIKVNYDSWHQPDDSKNIDTVDPKG
ncbi:MAG: hypothetical protein PVJ69_01385 [Desulfobacteraceae bacterium]|jgi:hypothetical protein